WHVNVALGAPLTAATATVVSPESCSACNWSQLFNRSRSTSDCITCEAYVRLRAPSTAWNPVCSVVIAVVIASTSTIEAIITSISEKPAQRHEPRRQTGGGE